MGRGNSDTTGSAKNHRHRGILHFVAGFTLASFLFHLEGILTPSWSIESAVPKRMTELSSSTDIPEQGGSTATATRNTKSHPLGRPGFVWPNAHMNIAPRRATERPFKTPALSVADILESIRRRSQQSSPPPLTGILVNVGADDGCLKNNEECDEANQLLPLQEGVTLTALAATQQEDVRLRNAELYGNVTFRGVLVEPGKLRLHPSVYQPDLFHWIHDNIHYFNAVDLLQEARVPHEFDLLKYDTDSADCEVLRVILEAGYRPKVIMAEFNIVFPPPLLFSQLVDNTPDKSIFRWGSKGPHFQQVGDQCSLSYLSQKIMAQFGYTLIQVDWWDAFYVQNHLVEVATGGAPLYDDLTWYLHGFIANAPSQKQRRDFLSKTAYTAMARGTVQKWINVIVNASMAGETMVLDEAQRVQMRTDFWWLAIKEGYVQAKDVNLATSSREKCHDGCFPQPFAFE